MAKKKPAPEKPMTKTELFGAIAEETELTKKQVAAVFDCLSEQIALHVKKSGPGVFTMPGLLKVTVVDKPKVPRRKGINPFTKEEQWFAAKPATRVVKIKPLKALKDLALKR